MIRTRKFVFIHMPKTGGTFVTAVLKRLAGNPRRGGYLGRLAQRWGNPPFIDRRKHGTVNDIPGPWRDRPILSVIRNPYDRLVSYFEFNWWKTDPPRYVDFRELRRRFPAWPEVKFPEFYEGFQLFQKLKAPGLPPEKRLGTLTENFVRFYFRDPERAFPRIDDAYIAARGWEKDMAPVRFLRMEHLNGDLYDALVEHGWPAEEVEFILCLGRILPEHSKKGPRPRWADYYTPELKAKVRERERLLFAMFPEYDE